jgi:hypothetical protein
MKTRPRALLALPIIALLSTALLADPVSLTFQPEEELEITYELEASGERIIRAAGQPPERVNLEFEATRIDLVETVDDDGIILTRTLKDIVYEEDGDRVAIPPSIEDEAIAFSADSEGNVLPVDETWDEEAPENFGDFLNLLETVPFGDGPVEVGEKWDASPPEDDQDTEGVEIVKDVSEAEIVAIYESEGMEVALIRQRVDAVMIYKDQPQEGVNLRGTIQAEILQSNRVEDGVLLGVKGRLYQKLDVMAPQGEVLWSMELPDLEGTLRVAEE